jgi:hypothetical protein
LQFFRAREQGFADAAVDSYSSCGDSMWRAFTATYDGTPGLAGLDHLAEYEKHVRLNPVGINCPAVRVRTEISWFAASFEAHSPFQIWCDEQLSPVLETLDVVIGTGTVQEKQQVALEAATVFLDAQDSYRDEFCCSNVTDLAKLVNTQFSQSSSLVDIIKVVNKCNTLYTVNADRVPEQHLVVEMLLQRLPPYYSSKVLLGLAGIAGDRELRYTFANVGRILKRLNKTHDSMLFLQLTACTPASDLYDSSLDDSLFDGSSSSATSCKSTDSSVDVFALAFAQLSDADKCRALAAIKPQGVCPIHDGAHILQDCPHVVGTQSSSDTSDSVDVYAAAAGTTLKSMLQAQASQLADLEQRFEEASAYAAAFLQQQQPWQQDPQERQYEPCSLCLGDNHCVDNCWVARPDKCSDHNKLIAQYYTWNDACRTLFLSRLKKYGLYDAIAPQLKLSVRFAQ